MSDNEIATPTGTAEEAGAAPQEEPRRPEEETSVPAVEEAAGESPESRTEAPDPEAPAPDAEQTSPGAGEAAPAAEPTDGYSVKLEMFEGPMDLLLFLIRKKKIEINDIPIAVITRDYLEYLDRKEQINLDREAEFLFIAALLIYIKSQMLLPRETDLAENEDPRRVLVDRLLEYQKVKASCSLLRDRESELLQLWRRNFIPPVEKKDDLELLECSLFDLAETFFIIMKRKAAESARIIKGRDVSVDEKMTELLGVLKARKKFDFLEYFDAQGSLEEALISFFCVLELVKRGVVRAVQTELFRTIEVRLLEEGQDPDQDE